MLWCCWWNDTTTSPPTIITTSEPEAKESVVLHVVGVGGDVVFSIVGWYMCQPIMDDAALCTVSSAKRS